MKAKIINICPVWVEWPYQMPRIMRIKSRVSLITYSGAYKDGYIIDDMFLKLGDIVEYDTKTRVITNKL